MMVIIMMVLVGSVLLIWYMYSLTHPLMYIDCFMHKHVSQTASVKSTVTHPLVV